jgi:hypothetical protein
MPVLVEAFSVITRKDRIEESYPDGMDGFLRDCPNRTACFDAHLVRVGFMDPDSVREFVTNLGNHGLVHRDEHGRAQDLVVANQGQGPTTPCDWAEFFCVNLAGAQVEICRLAGTDSLRLACPGGWSPEKAAHSLVYVPPDELESRMEFLREENGLTVCRDRVTGKIMYSPSTKKARAVESTDSEDSPTPEVRPTLWQSLCGLFRGR